MARPTGQATGPGGADRTIATVAGAHRSKGDVMSQGARIEQIPPRAQQQRPAGTTSEDEEGDAATASALLPEGPVRRSPPLRRILIATDLLAVGVGWAATVLIAFVAGDFPFGAVMVAAQTVVVLGAGAVLISAAGLYRRSICAIRAQEVARIGRASVALALGTGVLLAAVGRDAAVLAALTGGVAWFSLLTLERGLFREWIHGRRAGGDFGAPVVVVGGDAESTLDTAAFLREHPVLGFSVRGIVSPTAEGVDRRKVSWLGQPDDLMLHLQRSRASGVVIDSSSMRGAELNAIVQQLSGTNLHIHVSSGLRGIDRRRISVAALADETFLHVAPMGLSRRQLIYKRFVDVTVGSLALLVTSPALVLSALAVWVYDRGPILFKQQRVGLDGEYFILYKLRTMVENAEAQRAELEADNARNGPLFKAAKDPRVTPVGRFLRASSLDELPQLFNVLEGTMSLVGPRPALADEVAQFDDVLNERLSVKPGITGLWQVEARDLPSFELYRRYDLLYVQNWSLGLDLAIIARTAAVVGFRTLTAVLPSNRRSHAVIE